MRGKKAPQRGICFIQLMLYANEALLKAAALATESKGNMIVKQSSRPQPLDMKHFLTMAAANMLKAVEILLKVASNNRNL